MRLACASFLLLALPVAAPAATSDHAACFDGGAPATATTPTEAEARGMVGLIRGAHVLPIYLRRLCQIAGPEDLAYVEALVTAAGCSPETPLGQRQSAFATGPLPAVVAAMTQGACHSETLGLTDGEVETVCRAVVDLPFPPGATPLAEDKAAALLPELQKIDAIIFNASKRGC